MAPSNQQSHAVALFDLIDLVPIADIALSVAVADAAHSSEQTFLRALLLRAQFGHKAVPQFTQMATAARSVWLLQCI